jgi:anti-sigma factor RsiW
MMEYQDQLKLQSYLDGELSEAEAREFAARLDRDPEGAALLTELKQTGNALAGFEQEIKLPESREFYWSKIQRDIQRQENAAPVPERRVPLFSRLRRLLVPAAGLAVVSLLALIATRDAGSGPGDAKVETALEDTGAFTYHDDSAGATLVWLSYPADNEGSDEDDLNSLD